MVNKVPLVGTPRASIRANQPGNCPIRPSATKRRGTTIALVVTLPRIEATAAATINNVPPTPTSRPASVASGAPSVVAGSKASKP